MIEYTYLKALNPFKQAKVLAIDNVRCSVYFVETLWLLQDNLQEGMEIIVFDLTEPFQPFSEGSFPKGGMKR